MISKNSDNMSSAKLDQGLTNPTDESKKKTPSRNGKNGKNGKKPTGSNQNEKTDDTPKMTSGTKEEFLVRYFNEGQLQPLMPKWLKYKPFKVRFHRTDSVTGVRQAIIDEESGLAEELGFEALVSIIQDDLSKFAIEEHPCQTYCLSYMSSRNLAKRLQYAGNQLDEWPLPLGFKSSKGIFFNRRPYDPIMNAEPFDFPFISSYLRRIQNSVPLCQVIGSVLAGAPLRKYTPLLFGDGGGGKSTFYRLLKNLFGEDAVGLVPKSFNDMFSYGFVENTAAWFGDDVDPKFLATPMYKELSGSDSFALRKIRQDCVKIKLNGVFFLNINGDKLVLPADKAVTQKRLIPCEVQITDEWLNSPEIKDMETIDKLAEEDFPAFSGYCLRKFYELKGGAISYDIDGIEDYIGGEDEIDFETLFDELYEFIPNWNIPDVSEQPRVPSAQFTRNWEELAKRFPSITRGKTHHHMRTWLCEKLELKNKKQLVVNVRVEGKQTRCIQGIKAKPTRCFS